ncbi:MAG: hypothetical protein RL557_1003 [archaeon]|jgi:SET domain-containing protein
MNKKYLTESWINPKIEVRQSPSHGLGLFAKESLNEGEVLVIWGGYFTDTFEAQKAKQKGKAIQQIAEDVWDVFDYETRHDDPSYNHNHSCDPNTWMQDEVTISARRNIKPNEELTIDYAMFILEDNWIMPGKCKCASILCRHTITGKDWKLKKLQKRYKNHFSPLINKRIKILQQQSL